MRPMYIEPGLPTRVASEYSALHIVRGEQAPTVIGVRNISRIVAPVSTRFSPGALALCMRSGIAIAFIDDHGNSLGFLHGRTPTRSSIPARLAELLSQPNGKRIYTTWWKAMESRCRCRLAKQLRIAPDRHRARVLRSVMRHATERRADEAIRAMLDKSWGPGLSSLVAELLHKAGFDAAAMGRLWPLIDMRQDLTGLLEWDLFLPRLTALNRLQAAAHASKARELLQAKIISSFECERTSLENRAWHILHRLDMRLMELGTV